MQALKQSDPLRYLDTLLGQYYKQQGNDTYYEVDEVWDDADKTPKGKFAIYCVC